MSNNKFFLFLVALMFVMIIGLASCGKTSTGHNTGADGYYFEKETFTRTEFPVEIVLVQSAAEMSKLISTQKRVQGTIEPKNVAAFSTIRLNDPKCKIYMIDPKVHYEPEFIGHELVHCIYGIWHREPQS
jgi:hypothetical protein